MKSIPIFLSSDNNYAPFVATTIASICDNTESFCEFYVLDGGISEENKEKIVKLGKQFNNFSIEYINIDTKKYFENLIETDKITKSMYNRFLIPYVKPEINKALYTDVDVIVVGDIAEMYNEDLSDYAIGAVWEDFFEDSYNKTRKENLKLSDSHKYFSSGNLLINCKKWRDDTIFEKLINLGKAFVSSLKWPDQDILNKYFDSNYKLLDRKYCFVDPAYQFSKDKQFIIRHYTAPLKPWKIAPEINSDLFPDTKLFWHYMQLTSFYTEVLQQCQIKNQDDLRKYKTTELIARIREQGRLNAK